MVRINFSLLAQQAAAVATAADLIGPIDFKV
jgi:hypothetical protein